jgi:hypothetical protein
MTAPRLVTWCCFDIDFFEVFGAMDWYKNARSMSYMLSLLGRNTQVSRRWTACISDI